MNMDFTFGPARETAWSQGFSIFLSHLADHVEAERDIADVRDNWDGALSLWTRDRNAAKTRLKKIITAPRALPVKLVEDRPLSRIVILADRMLDELEPELPRHLHRDMKGSFFRQYQVTGFGPVAQHRNALLIHARHLLDAIVVLPFYDHLPTAEPVQEDVPDDLELLLSAF